MKPNKVVGETQVSELYFWGGHGEVSGQFECGKVTLRYLVQEMRRRGLGLQLDSDKIPVGYDLLAEQTPLPFSYTALRFLTGREERNITSVMQLHSSAVWRYQKKPSWRPAALEPIRDDILAFKVTEDLL